MERMTLSERLRQVASHVPIGSRLLDVGSDHAYLPIYLLQEQRIASAIAGEVVDGPYQSALTNVKAYDLEEQIEVRLANGLAAMTATDEVDVITICGMGGRLIAEILEAGRDKLERVKQLILQPNNREDDLRTWLSTNGFHLVAEQLVVEHGKYYEILVAQHGQASLTSEDIRFGPYLRRENSLVFQAKWRDELSKLSWALEQIPLTHDQQRQLLTQKIAQIREVLS